MTTTKQPGTPPFNAMPGLPPSDDAEVQELMATVARLPRVNVETLVRHVYRAALGYERNNDHTYLTCLASDALVSIRLRSDPDYEKALADAPDEPHTHGMVDVEALLTRHGL